VRVTDDSGTRVVALALEDYVLGAVRAELAPSTLRDESLSRMLEVQALVSRTYALANPGRHAAEGFDLCDTTHCQVYRGALPAETGTDPAARAVASTRGQVITFQGRVIQALFHANCGGYTASGTSVWGGTGEPYLRAVPDWFCSRKAAASDWSFSTDETGLLRALSGNPALDVGPSLRGIDVSERDASGRVLSVTLAGSRTVTARAEAFRSTVRQAFGERSLRSSRFTIARDGTRFLFSGTGSGHGVGLCQAGALERARAGLSVIEIITHYFPGTFIEAASPAVLTPRSGS
jgi:stage II sporulation protein D